MLNESYKSVPVIIADDHELARAGLRAILSNETWIEIVGEAENGREAHRGHSPNVATAHLHFFEPFAERSTKGSAIGNDTQGQHS